MYILLFLGEQEEMPKKSRSASITSLRKLSRKPSVDAQTLLEEKLEVGHFFDLLHTMQYSQK